MKNLLMTGIAVLMLCGPGAWAQQYPVYESTGTMDVTVDGKQATYHTTSNTIPGQPGKMVHTANWRTFAPMMLGSVNIAPPGILISMTSRLTVQPDSASPHMKITFYLDETDHTLLDSPPFEVVYTVKEGALAGEYQHVSGAVIIHSVVPEGDILKVSGRASGALARTDGKNGTGPTLDYETNFDVRTYRH